jgi:hypothetical protein
MPPPHPRPRNILSPGAVKRRHSTVPLPINAHQDPGAKTTRSPIEQRLRAFRHPSSLRWNPISVSLSPVHQPLSGRGQIDGLKRSGVTQRSQYGPCTRSRSCICPTWLSNCSRDFLIDRDSAQASRIRTTAGQSGSPALPDQSRVLRPSSDGGCRSSGVVSGVSMSLPTATAATRVRKRCRKRSARHPRRAQQGLFLGVRWQG